MNLLKVNLFSISYFFAITCTSSIKYSRDRLTTHAWVNTYIKRNKLLFNDVCGIHLLCACAPTLFYANKRALKFSSAISWIFNHRMRCAYFVNSTRWKTIFALHMKPTRLISARFLTIEEQPSWVHDASARTSPFRTLRLRRLVNREKFAFYMQCRMPEKYNAANEASTRIR